MSRAQWLSHPAAGHRAPVPPCLCQHLFPVSFFLTRAFLMGVKWYLIGALFSVVDHKNSICSLSFSSVQSLSRVRLFATP